MMKTWNNEYFIEEWFSLLVQSGEGATYGGILSLGNYICNVYEQKKPDRILRQIFNVKSQKRRQLFLVRFVPPTDDHWAWTKEQQPRRSIRGLYYVLLRWQRRRQKPGFSKAFSCSSLQWLPAAVSSTKAKQGCFLRRWSSLRFEAWSLAAELLSFATTKRARVLLHSSLKHSSLELL